MAAAAQKIDVVIGAKDMFSSTMKRAESQFDRYGKSVVTTAAKATAAIYSLSKAWDLAGEAAKFDQQEQAFTNLAASYDANAQDIISSLKQVSGQTVSTAAAMDSAGKAMLLGIPAERLSGMMEIARASAKITGQTVQEAFNDIAVGIGRQSPMILDNLGITLKLSDAYSSHAAVLGKTTKQLTDAEKKQAFLNAVMKSGKSIVDRVGKSTLTAADAQAIFSAKMQDMKIIAGKVIITVTAGLSGIAFAISKVFAQSLKTAATAVGKLDQLMAKLPFYKATPGILEFADAQGAAAKEADRLMKQSFGMAIAIWKEKEAVEGLSKARAEKAEVSTAAAVEATPEADPKIQATLLRMQYRDEEIMQIASLTDAMAYHAERGVEISANMAAATIADNQRMAWSAQARASITGRANSAMQDTMLKLIETGKFSVGAFAKIMAQQVKIELAGISAKATVRALYETGLGFATAFTNPAESAGHFTAAVHLAGIAAASVAAGAAVHAVAGGSAEKPAAGTAGGEPIRTQDTGALIGGDTSRPEAAGPVINIHIAGVISPDNMDRVMEEHVAPAMERYSDRGGQVTMNVVSVEA